MTYLAGVSRTRKGASRISQISHHLTKHIIGFINRLRTYPMSKVLMATNRIREVSRHSSPPTLNPPNIRILIESVIDLDKIENFRIRLQKRLIWDFKVSPATRPNKIISQQPHIPRFVHFKLIVNLL